jgi:hypothetical protein
MVLGLWYIYVIYRFILRDYFAGKALQMLMTNYENDFNWNAHEYSMVSYEIAKAMMKARK